METGVPQADFAAITRSVSDKNSPMHIDLLHRYVHDPISDAGSKRVGGGLNHAQPLFEKIWP